MSEYLTAKDIDKAAFSLNAIFGEVHPPASVETLLKSVLAQARLAPDPAALPLSVAMRLARERTEAGDETWVLMKTPTASVTVFRKNLGIWYRARPNRYGIWDGAGVFSDKEVEAATCRLVSPAEGNELLRGGE